MKHLIALLLLSVLLVACDSRSGDGLKIHSLNSWQQGEERYLADIRLGFSLPDVVIEALENGVPLVFILTTRLQQQEGGWLDAEDARQHVFRVRYRPLSTFYEVEVFSGGNRAQQRFATRAALFDYLGGQREFMIANAQQLRRGQRYQVAAAIELDIDSLPLPMRPKAYLSPSWNQRSGWSQWPLSH